MDHKECVLTTGLERSCEQCKRFLFLCEAWTVARITQLPAESSVLTRPYYGYSNHITSPLDEFCSWSAHVRVVVVVVC